MYRGAATGAGRAPVAGPDGGRGDGAQHRTRTGGAGCADVRSRSDRAGLHRRNLIDNAVRYDRQKAIKAYKIAFASRSARRRRLDAARRCIALDQASRTALQAYPAVIAFKPGNGAAWNWQGVRYLQRKDYKQAIPAFTEALKNGESTALVFEELGKAFQENGQGAKTEESFLKAIELALLNAMPRMRLRELHRKSVGPTRPEARRSAVKLAPRTPARRTCSARFEAARDSCRKPSSPVNAQWRSIRR